METKVILTLRAMAWERAKGELRAYLQTFWETQDCIKTSTYYEARTKINDFITEFEEFCK